MPLLSVTDLATEFDTDEGTVRAVDGVGFSIEAGETLGLVGESGCGKSVTALSIMQLLPRPMGRIAAGRIEFEGSELAGLEPEAMQRVRGARIGMVFQEPMTALNPVHTIGRQITEAIRLHKAVSEREALREALDILDRVGIPAPDIRLGEYPHQLSGGMRQRVVIAIALVLRPALLIADEPTTALDVTVQAQILELIRDLQRSLGMAVLLITHDLGVIAETCERVAVMYAGRMVEQGSVYDLFERPVHPYSRGLLTSIPRLTGTPKARLATIEGMVPGLRDLPAGCRFANRCPQADAQCRTDSPATELVTDAHSVACHHWRRLPEWQGIN